MVKFLFSGWRLLSTPLALLATILFLSLGFWQVNRLQQRLAQNQLIQTQMQEAPTVLDGSPIDPQTYAFRRVSLRGSYEPSGEILWRNRSYNQVTGYNLLTPFRISGSGTVILVNRGWVPLAAQDPAVRATMAPPSGEVTISGVARTSQEQANAPQDLPNSQAQPLLEWYQINIPRIQTQLGAPLLPVFVDLQPEAGAPAMPIRVATSDLGPGSHMSYALQWFSFAFITVIGYGAIMHQRRLHFLQQRRAMIARRV